MIRTVLLPALALTLVYALATGLLVALLTLLRVPSRWARLGGCLAFGLGSGALAAWLWPYDSCVYANLYGVTLGDWLYRATAAGRQPPWLLTVPQVYVLTSGLLGAAVGLALFAQRVRCGGVHRPEASQGEPGGRAAE